MFVSRQRAKGSGLLYAIYRIGKTNLARRAYLKVAILRELQVLSRAEAAVALLQSEIDRQWNDWQLWKFQSSVADRVSFRSMALPADKIDGALGLGFSSAALLFALILLLLLIIKRQNSEMALVVIIVVFACIWATFRVSFWVGFWVSFFW